jgi:hypothetical protein
MTQQKDAFTDVASALQGNTNTNNGSNGNNSNNNNSDNQPTGTVIGTNGETVTLGINGNVNKK